MFKAGRLFVFILMVFVFLRLYATQTSPFEGPDEKEHFAYANLFREQTRLPDPEKDIESLIQQEAAQPPLYYVVLGGLSKLTGKPAVGDHPDIANNPWHGYVAPVTSFDNRNAHLMDPDLNVLTPEQLDTVEILGWMRGFTLLFALIFMLAAYWAGWEYSGGNHVWAMFTALAVTLSPLNLRTFSIVTNDAAIVAFGTLTIAAALALYRLWTSPRIAIIAGIAAGLAALCKASGLAFWGIPLLALGIEWLQHRTPPKTIIRQGLIVIGAAALISGWWYIRAWVLYDDPLGANPHLQMPWAFAEPQPIADVLDRLPIIRLTLWANFGVGEIRPDWWGYVLPVVAIVVGIVGWRGQRVEGKTLLLVAVVLIGGAALLRWMQMFNAITARLFLPFYPALVLLVIKGISSFPRTRYWLAAGFGGLALLIIPLTLYPVFSHPVFIETPVAGIQGPQVWFEGAKFEGYAVDDDRIRPGNTKHFRLCWSAPSDRDNLPVPYAFALHVLTPDEETIIGRRDSYPGMGKYTLWEEGRTFCDAFDLDITGPTEAATAYPIKLSLFDPVTGGVIQATDINGNAVGTPTIGYLRAPAPAVSDDELQQASYRFGDIHLLEFDHRVEEDLLTVDFTWGTVSAPPDDLKLFVHVMDMDDEIAAQSDVVPGTPRYPVFAWGAREKIETQSTVDLSALEPGEYRVMIGFYDPFVRLPAFTGDGTRLEDDAVELTVITIK